MPDVLRSDRFCRCLPVLLLTLMLAAPAQAADPTAPPAWARSAPASAAPERTATGRVAPVLPKLQQIVHGEQSRAVINGRLLAIGDEVDGYQLIAIGPDSVRLQSRQGVRELSLIKETLRESAVSGQTAPVTDAAQDNKRTKR